MEMNAMMPLVCGSIFLFSTLVSCVGTMISAGVFEECALPSVNLNAAKHFNPARLSILCPPVMEEMSKLAYH
ncbi:hypothetical protein CLOM_g12857 [Closterium sp. NIES-68]|nr:hypothetical protein CLOM_g21875 [Closterium sp. NIES-68]GJP53705.1 hypothetical protein CLOM_g12857 [Closterium sp. NIES-68]GJP66475.1 hypothetical protein CLOP_g23405 [Closterium sp. NIES-67]